MVAWIVHSLVPTALNRMLNMAGVLFTLLSIFFFNFHVSFIPSTTFVAFNFLLISELTYGFNGVKGSTVLKIRLCYIKFITYFRCLLLKKDTAPFSELINNDSTLF